MRNGVKSDEGKVFFVFVSIMMYFNNYKPPPYTPPPPLPLCDYALFNDFQLFLSDHLTIRLIPYGLCVYYPT